MAPKKTVPGVASKQTAPRNGNAVATKQPARQANIEEENLIKSRASEPAEELSSGAELKLHWHVLAVSMLGYIFLQSSNAFVPAFTMEYTSEDLGMSLSEYGLMNSVGAGIKSILIIFLMGHAIDHWGPHRIIIVRPYASHQTRVHASAVVVHHSLRQLEYCMHTRNSPGAGS